MDQYIAHLGTFLYNTVTVTNTLVKVWWDKLILNHDSKICFFFLIKIESNYLKSKLWLRYLLRKGFSLHLSKTYLDNFKPTASGWLLCKPTTSAVARMTFSSRVTVLFFHLNIFKAVYIGQLTLHDLLQVVIQGPTKWDDKLPGASKSSS